MRTWILLLGLMILPHTAVAQDIFEAPIRLYPDRAVDLESLDIHGTFQASSRSFRMEVRASIRATERNVLQFSWPTHGLPLDSIFVEMATGDTAMVAVRGDSLTISLAGPLSLDQLSTVRLVYDLRPGAGLIAPTDPAMEGSCCLSPARVWLPVPDDPGDRVTVSLSLSVPDSWTVLGVGTKRRGDGTWHYAPRRTVRVQDLTFVAGHLEKRNLGRFEYHVPADYNPSTGLHASLSDAFDFFLQRTGYRLPWDTLRVAILPSLSPASGPSNQGFPGLLVMDAAPSGSGQFDPASADVLPRAVARQWTHAVLSPDWWSESWVNEALAGAMAGAYLADRTSDAASAATRLAQLDAYLQEAQTYRRPLVWDRYVVASDLDDQHVLSKGPLVLTQVIGEIGPTAFWTSIRRLLARHAFSGIDTEALSTALEPGGAGPVSAIFDTWVFGAGHPEITVESLHDVESETLHLRALQTQDGPLVPATFRFRTEAEWLPFGGPARETLQVEETEQEWAIPSIVGPRYAIIDPEGLVVADITLPGDLASLSAQLRYGSASTRLRAARKLAAFGNDPAVGLSIRLTFASETSPEVRAELMRAAGAMPSSGSAHELLEQGLGDPDHRVRVEAIRALRGLYAAGEADVLFEQVAQGDTVQWVQAEAVLSMTGPGAEALARAALITASDGDVIFKAGWKVLSGKGLITRADFLTHTTPSGTTARILGALELVQDVPSDRQTRLRVLAHMSHPAVAVRSAAIQWGGSLLRKGNDPAIRTLLRKEWHIGVQSELETLSDKLGSGSW
ncbi:MAG: aminopeptidase N [Rhodothermales bacterium]|jgi:aminopeptidase N